MGIHFIQESYRRILNSMARPGKIEVILDNLDKEASNTTFLFGSYTIMKVLIDNETSFKVISNDENKDREFIFRVTGGRYLDDADYIFVGIDKNKEIQNIIQNAKIGDLVNPELGATIICEVNDLTKGENMILSGPGILNEKKVKLPLAKYWLNERNNKVVEYPMGIDLIFVDTSGQVLSIPRTTMIREDL